MNLCACENALFMNTTQFYAYENTWFQTIS